MVYPIYYGNQEVGEVQAKITGLYYHFLCRCIPPDSALYRIYLLDGTKEENLGICVPDGQYFSLSKKVPMKSINGGQWTFHLRSRASNDKLKVSVAEDQPFPMLSKLENARLCYENGDPFIVFKVE